MLSNSAPTAIYKKALEAYLAADLSKLLRILKSPEISRFEIALFEARLSLKANDNAKAGEILSRIETSDSFLLGEKYFLLASLLSYKSQWQMAAATATKSLLNYQLVNDERGLFLANYNLSVYYNRLGLDDLSDEFVNTAASYARTPSQSVLILRARSCSSLRKGDIEKAVSEIEEALGRIDQIDAVDAAHTRAVAAETFIRAGMFDKAEENLNSLIRSKTLPDKARVKFDLLLISLLRDPRASSIGVSCPDLIAENAEYSLKWKLIKALQDGDPKEATACWSKLVALMPLRYCEEYGCVNESDTKSLFMKVVNILMQADRKVSSVVEFTGKQKLLFEALRNSPIALRKEVLIERVWRCDYDPALDARFYKLVERLKQSSGLQIEVSRQTYRLSLNNAS